MEDDTNLSGAVVLTLENSPNLVRKFTRDQAKIPRLLAQARYMTSLRALSPSSWPIVPRVHRTMNDGYIMDRGTNLDLWSVAYEDLLRVMKIRLATHVWLYPPIVPVNEDWSDQLATYLLPMMRRHNVADTMITITASALRRSVVMHGEPCAIHGDCTIDNLLMPLGVAHDRVAVEAMWISDPLPPDPRIPSFRQVDLGKLLQSACGWENIKYGGIPPIQVEPCNVVVLGDENVTTRWLSWFWCLVHHARILPYVYEDASMTHAVISQMSEIASHLRRLDQ